MSTKDYLPEDLNNLNRSKDEALELLNNAVLCSFKDSLKRRRRQLQMKQTDLADTVGIKQPAISRIENHDNKSLSLTTLQDVAIGMDCILNIELVPRTDYIKRLTKADFSD